jgi:hypothetical protein
MRQRAEAEEQAWEQFDKTVFDRCFGGRTLTQLRAQPPKRSEFVNNVNCRTRLINETVGPVAMYPDLLAKMRATALTNAQAYAKGTISFEDVLARGQENDAAYIRQYNARSGQDLAQSNQTGAVFIDFLARTAIGAIR